ncbi:MAG: hypothetical protein HN919_14905 [Verrucomicrobia bacterium]|nr:hypothetical protein [Verrucomicrobiota bacterium]
MKKRMVLLVVVAMAAVAAISCRRSDMRTAVVDVPGMSDAMDIRIVTNAALDQVVGQYDGVKSDYDVDLSRKIVLYHESRNLMSPAYQRKIVDRIAEVGFTAEVIKAGFNPPSPVDTIDGPHCTWPRRFTAVISVSDMASNTDANIVVDAIAYARLGCDDPRIVVDPQARRVVALYESMRLSLKAIEYSIACVGYDANSIPSQQGRADAVPHGWSPIRL